MIAQEVPLPSGPEIVTLTMNPALDVITDVNCSSTLTKCAAAQPDTTRGAVEST